MGAVGVGRDTVDQGHYGTEKREVRPAGGTPRGEGGAGRWRWKEFCTRDI